MRIIAGNARGTPLITHEGGEVTRPTSGRAKEAVFSMLSSLIAGRGLSPEVDCFRGITALDLFAGSGQMGLEAVSRGAESCIFVDNSPSACDIIRKNAAKSRLAGRVSILLRDCIDYCLRGEIPHPAGLVFLDPPYAARGESCPAITALMALAGRGLLADGCLIVREGRFGGAEGFPGISTDGAADGRFELIREKKYGIALVEIMVFSVNN